MTADHADDPDAILAQARAVADPARTLAVAVPLVRAKLLNYATLLDRLAPAHAGVAQLRDHARRAAAASSLDALRGLEGSGAAAWYRALPAFLGPGFRFARRVAPDADDPVNLLLNLGFTMLHRQVAAAVRAAGLSPALGFLHQSTPRYAALAADLQEPFRHLVDRAVVVATRRLKPSQFVEQPGGRYPLRMDHRAAKLFHAVLQRSWRAAVAGKGQTDPRPWLVQLSVTARHLRRHLVDPTSPWEPFEHP